MKKTAKGGQVRNWRKRDLARDEASTGLGTLEGLIKEGRDVLAQEVEAQAVEAVPAGQLAFRGRGWGKRGLAGKVEPLAGVPVAVLMPPSGASRTSVQETICGILESRKSRRLGGLSIRAMIEEGRR